MTTLKILGSLSAIAMFCAPALVSARSVSVDVHDLDLASKAGRDQLDKRIDRAARRVCATNEIRGAAATRREASCRVHAKDTAKAQLSQN